MAIRTHAQTAASITLLVGERHIKSDHVLVEHADGDRYIILSDEVPAFIAEMRENSVPVTIQNPLAWAATNNPRHVD